MGQRAAQPGEMKRAKLTGWKRCAAPSNADKSPVYQHDSGARIHTSGLVRTPDGRHFAINNLDQAGSFPAHLRIRGNKRRALMAWAMELMEEKQ